MPLKKILVFPFDLMSHYTRCVVLAEKFYGSDSEVLFQSSSRYNGLVVKHGFKTFDCETFDSYYVMQCAAKFDFSWLNERDVERVFLSQIKAIEHHQPDLVIGDTSPTLKMAAEKTGVAYTALTNGYMTKHYAHTRKLSRTHVAYRHVSRLPERLGDRITNYAEKLAFKNVHAPFRCLRKKYGLKHVDTYLDELEGDENLICDLPELFLQKNLPDNFRFIGPLIYERADLPIAEFSSSKPNILVCMGSTGDWKALIFLNDVVFAEYHIITAGDKHNLLHAPHISPYDFINLSQAASRVDLMICHGGNGTIYHGLLNEVYMLCLTDNFEQEWNVHALERIGIGLNVSAFNGDWKTLIESKLETATQRVDAAIG
jgi:UDP:flavonoid glycosyltransferase YjiC (YdhE family)